MPSAVRVVFDACGATEQTCLVPEYSEGASSTGDQRGPALVVVFGGCFCFALKSCIGSLGCVVISLQLPCVVCIYANSTVNVCLESVFFCRHQTHFFWCSARETGASPSTARKLAVLGLWKKTAECAPAVPAA